MCYFVLTASPEFFKVSTLDKQQRLFCDFTNSELNSIARVLYSSIIEYCNSEKGKKDYAEWQKQRQLNIKNQKNVAPL